MLRLGTMSRSDFIWLSMCAAMVQSLFFGLAEMYLPALLCIHYPLFILICNLIRETRNDIKRKRDCANRGK